MYLPDHIESAEIFAQSWANDHVKDNKFLCGCGNWCDMKDGETLSFNPYAIPVCPDCFNEWWDSHGKVEK